jgi:hypothetical protein
MKTRSSRTAQENWMDLEVLKEAIVVDDKSVTFDNNVARE